MDEKDINRLMLHFERIFRDANKKYINPEINEVSIEDLEPMINMVAKSRAAYLKYMYELGKKYDETDSFPSADELKKLKVLRMRFNEVSEGAQAFETCIQRGYMDIKSNQE